MLHERWNVYGEVAREALRDWLNERPLLEPCERRGVDAPVALSSLKAPGLLEVSEEDPSLKGEA